MTKQELLSLANKGKTEINGYPLEVVVYPSSVDGTPWIEIHVDPLSPLHAPLLLGQTWVEFVTEEDCAELPKALDRYKREAEEFCRQAETVVKAHLNADGTYTFTDVPESVKANYADYPSALRLWLKQSHTIQFIGKQKEHWRAPGTFSLDLDGVIYKPIWSYWLDCACYETTSQINKAD